MIKNSKPLANSNKCLNLTRASPHDRIICKICKKTYCRSSLTKHRQTQYHILYQDMHNRFSNVLFNTPADPFSSSNT